MHIGIIGINHKSADLQLREKLAKACRRRLDHQFSAHPTCSYILLSTCNRTEIYFNSTDLAETHSYLLSVLRLEVEDEFEHKIYSYFGIDCFYHLACVTSGLDSAIIGETEIQGQVKQAYESASCFHKLAKELHFLFQKCLKIGKEIRSSARLKVGLPTLEEAILKAGGALMSDLSKRRILFVGLSEINYKIFRCFRQRGFQDITFCNRTGEKVQEIEQLEKIAFLPWERLDEWHEFDVTIFGTKCPEYLITQKINNKNHLEPRLLIDLSVPRNVDPIVGRSPNVTLLNVDKLNRAIDRKRKLKAIELARLEMQLIGKAVETQVGIFQLKELQKNQFHYSFVG